MLCIHAQLRRSGFLEMAGGIGALHRAGLDTW